MRFRSGWIEIIQHRQQIAFGKKHHIRGAEHHRVFGGFVVALGNREQVTFLCWPRSKLAGHTRFPTFSINRMSRFFQRKLRARHRAPCAHPDDMPSPW